MIFPKVVYWSVWQKCFLMVTVWGHLFQLLNLVNPEDWMLCCLGESQARALVAVRQEDREDILQAAEQIGVPALCLGQTDQSDQLGSSFRKRS